MVLFPQCSFGCGGSQTKKAIFALAFISSFIVLSLLATIPASASNATMTVTAKVNYLQLGEYRNVTMEDMLPGMILLWTWSVQGNVSFFVQAPDSSYPVLKEHFNSSQTSGVLVVQSGTYLIGWKSEQTNVNLSYTCRSFTPEVKLTSPAPGSSLTNLDPAISGTYDDFVKQITITSEGKKSAFAQMSRGEWKSSLPLESGSNTFTIVSYYQIGDFNYNHTENVSLYADTQWIYSNDGSLLMGNSLLILFIAIIVTEVIAFGYIYVILK